MNTLYELTPKSLWLYPISTPTYSTHRDTHTTFLVQVRGLLGNCPTWVTEQSRLILFCGREIAWRTHNFKYPRQKVMKVVSAYVSKAGTSHVVSPNCLGKWRIIWIVNGSYVFLPCVERNE